MPDNINNVSVLNVNKNFLETDSPQTFEQFVLFVIPIKLTHMAILSKRVPYVNNLWVSQRPPFVHARLTTQRKILATLRAMWLSMESSKE